MRALVAVCLGLLVAGRASADPRASTAGILRTARAEIRWRPGSRAGADADRQAVAVERDLDRIAAALKATPKGPFQVWLYDDLYELAEATGTSGNAGFSSGQATHIPFDNDQTRLHELVHLVAYEWPRSGAEPRNLFFAEGLANAVLEFVHGVHVHAVAAHYRRAKKLPPLAEMTAPADFYAWQRAHPGFNAYDVGASWMRFLLDAHGAAKVRKYYTGTSAKAAFGSEEAALEKAWHALLDGYELRSEVETLLRRRDGEGAAFLPYAEGVPAALLGTPEAWTSALEGELAPERAERWRKAGTALTGSNDADAWTACDLAGGRHEACVVRATVTTTGYTPVEVRFGPQNRVLFVQPGTFLFRGDTAVASDPAVRWPMDSSRRELVVLRRGSRLEAWVNGKQALTTDAGAAGDFRVGVGIHKGSATFEDVRVRPAP